METENTLPCGCTKTHDPNEKFYVGFLNDHQDGYGIVLGPYDTHEEAADNVDRGRVMAAEIDGRLWFAVFGVVVLDKIIHPKLGK